MCLKILVAMHSCDNVVQANKLVIVLQAQQARRHLVKGIPLM